MLSDVASALDYLHNFEPPILHRDLKSLNMMLLDQVTNEHDNVVVKLGDFGFARILEEIRSMTRGVGTKHWMAPEVLAGTNYTEKADIFSFAMAAFEVICRQVPFEMLDPTSVAQAISRGERPEWPDPQDDLMPNMPDGAWACARRRQAAMARPAGATASRERRTSRRSSRTSSRTEAQRGRRRRCPLKVGARCCPPAAAVAAPEQVDAAIVLFGFSATFPSTSRKYSVDMAEGGLPQQRNSGAEVAVPQDRRHAHASRAAVGDRPTTGQIKGEIERLRNIVQENFRL
ncbi:unnamed protein product [Prorocentrum cordatum]|uniref:Protein kinase domain-containing protein n=1 Tax=Prorocentrum cordatum TaxID=2364126 RepID=A0ABN9Y3H7_9DINO|nr:unnamed protein product [Polarella glacialis]